MIPITERYCEQHKKEKSIRHKEYDATARDQKSKEFYNSGEWLKTRSDVLDLDNHIDVFVYMTEGTIIKADTVHHIEELKNNWGLRLDKKNLISLSSKTHGKIEKMYKKDAKSTKNLLKKILAQYRKMLGYAELSQ